MAYFKFMEKFFSDFGIQPILLLAQIVNFLILLFLLKKFLYGPIVKVLDQRRDTIADSLKNAEEIETKLAKTEEEYEKRIAKASAESRKIIDEATKSASEIIKDAHTKAAEDMSDIMQKGRDSIVMEQQKMQQQMRSELTELVVMTLEKVTGKVLNKKDQVDIIEKTVKGM
jgi:F-type H+-transporting ATPase subunit b